MEHCLGFVASASSPIDKSAEENNANQKQNDIEPLNLTDDIENEHGSQAKLDEQLIIIIKDILFY